MGKIASKAKVKPCILIDTCIARDITENRRKASSELINRIKREGWACKMSIFGLMELIDVEQEEQFVKKEYFIEKKTLDEIINKRKSRNLDKADFKRSWKYIEKFLDDCSFIKLATLDEDNWSVAGIVATHSNLNASDVIHLVCAAQNECDILVTDDQFFIKEANRFLEDEEIDKPVVCSPEDSNDILKEMGFIDS